MNTNRAADVQHAPGAMTKRAIEPPHHRVVIGEYLLGPNLDVLSGQCVVVEFRARRQPCAGSRKTVEHPEIEAESFLGEELLSPPPQQRGSSDRSLQKLAHDLRRARMCRHRTSFGRSGAQAPG
jgi:hypothetical protein